VWTIDGPTVLASAAGALGSGQVDVQSGTLLVSGSINALTGGVTVNAGGTIRGESTSNWGDVYMDGGLIALTRKGNITVTGDITVNAPSTLRGRAGDAGKIHTMGATFHGSEKMIFNNPAGYSRVQISANNSGDFTGGWDIDLGTLELTNALGLGGGLGPAGVSAGPLYIDADGALSLGGTYDLHVFGLELENEGVIAGSEDGITYNITDLPNYATYFSGTTAGSTITVYAEPAPIAEPAGLGLVGLALLAIRKKRS